MIPDHRPGYDARIGATVCPVRRLAVTCLALVTASCLIATPAHAADRDHDRIFDDLEAQLSGSAALPVVVTLDAPASAERVAALQRVVGDLGDVERLHIVPAFSASATPDQVRALADEPGVAHVEYDAPAVPFGVSAQAGFGVTGAREELPGLDGGGLAAAVIDSGVDPSAFADLGGGKVLAFKDLTSTRTDAYDDVGHGSVIASILAGSGATGADGLGVAPGAGIVAIKVVDKNALSSLDLIAQGIQWAVDHRADYGIRVINLSLGSPDAPCPDGTDVASQAVGKAVDAGLVVVTAVGNFGPEPCTVKAPAIAPSAIGVGAMSDPGAGGFATAWYSSRGDATHPKPDVMAPGDGLVAPKPGGGFQPVSGTSAAAPFVSGLALLMLDAHPSLTPAQVKAAIVGSAIDWGPPGWDPETGAGRLDAYRALELAGSALATPPAVPSHVAWQASDDAQSDFEVADAGAPLALILTGPKALDFALLDATGTVIATPTHDMRPWPLRQQDIVIKVPAAGRYTARVRGVGAFTVDISADLAPGDVTPPALTLDTLGQTLAGNAGTAFGDFPGVVVHVRQGATELRRLGAFPLLGRWTATLDPPLPEGRYAVEAEQGDASGNVANAAAALTIEPAPTPTPTAVATASPAPTPEPTVHVDPPPKLPKVTLAVSRQKLATARRKGVVVSLGCTGTKRVELRLILGTRDVAKRSVACKPQRVVLKLDTRRLKRLKRVTLTLAARAGDRVVTKRVKLS